MGHVQTEMVNQHPKAEGEEDLLTCSVQDVEDVVVAIGPLETRGSRLGATLRSSPSWRWGKRTMAAAAMRAATPRTMKVVWKDMRSK